MIEGQTDNGQYDTTKPVIEKVEFPKKVTTIKADEALQLYVYAYDTETEDGELRIETWISAGSLIEISFLLTVRMLVI